MAKYKAITAVKTSDGVIHPPKAIVELTDEEALKCLGFHAVEWVEELSASDKAPILATESPEELHDVLNQEDGE